ncbi:fatty acyl-CoA synthetase [Galactobacter caseinivorans]|uniref:Acyl-CoA synthetase n=1 Tax=Galactobacter caseinivorans TaxID=2676123 RepID=A0A496PJ32_9MICC|nr:fatty acyl-CoA synthetase [Galactobacter caseinivorans]RKW70506.1 acyl-CoA synthetase [Galactobacter caseinivorans]
MNALEDTIAAARSTRLDSLLTRSAERTPHAAALRFEEREWSYAELEAAVDRVAVRLLGAGLSRGDRVAAYGLNSDAYAVLFLACARAGLVHVPVNFALKGDELRYLLEDSGATLLAADPALRATVKAVFDAGGAASVRQVWDLLPPPGGEGHPSVLTTALDPAPHGGTEALAAVRVDGDDLVQLLYTSGTTSAPKGAMMTHAALMAEYVSATIALDLDAEDRPLVAMPLYHSAAMHVFLMPYLALGATVRLLPKPDVGQIVELVESERARSLFLAPTVWVPLANHPELATRDLSSLTKAQYGASIMPVTVLARLRERYPSIGFYNCFGQSELGPLCTVLRPEEHEARPASAGRPVYFVQARVLTANGDVAGQDEPGEIQYRGPQLFKGYWNKPEQTAEAFDGAWFRSGDQVTKDAGGFITVVDRIKDVINTGGVLVAPREVEDAIYELESVAEVAVIGLPDERWIEAVTAVVVLKPGASLTAEAVRAHVKERIAAFKVPKAVEFVQELPRNQSGKLLKRELRAERS